MATCAEVAARTLYDEGVRQMYGLPGGEILDFIEAARAVGIEFTLVRDEGTAAFMADVQGQMDRNPGVCVSTLGPGAMNMTLGVANAYLDRSPMIAVTASLSTQAAPVATHQNLDLNGIYGKFTKMAITLDGTRTEEKVREAFRTSLRPRMGPVHIAIPRDVGGEPEREGGAPRHTESAVPQETSVPSREELERMAQLLQDAERPVVVVGLDLHPHEDREAVLRFVESMGVPVFATPKAKGIVPEDHPLFHGVCAGVAGDSIIVELFEESDLLVGLGFEPVESDKLWHHTMRMVNVGPVSIAADEYVPDHECVGPVPEILDGLSSSIGSYQWEEGRLEAFRNQLRSRLRPEGTRSGPGISPYELTLRLRELLPPETIHLTDVGSIKYITSQAWKSFSPLTFFESNGLSSMGYAFPGAMALRKSRRAVPILATVGDGGFGMRVAELETCIREDLPFLTVVYNDNSLSLIRVAQESRGYPNYGVDYGPVDFAAVARGFGAWSRRVEALSEVDAAVKDALASGRPAVIDAVLDPAEYRAHAR